MKRYVLSQIFCDTEGLYGEPGEWHHALQKYPDTDYVGGDIKTDDDPNSPTYGKPTEKSLLVLVGSAKFGQFKDDPQMSVLPVFDPGVKVTATDTVQKLKFKREAVSLGHSEAEMDEVLAAGEGWRSVIEHFGKKNNANFNIDDFDVNES